MPVTSAVMITFPLSKLSCGNCVYLSMSVSDFYYYKMEIHFWAKLRLWMLRSHLEEDRKAERGHLSWQLRGVFLFLSSFLSTFHSSSIDQLLIAFFSSGKRTVHLNYPLWVVFSVSLIEAVETCWVFLFIHSDTYELNHIWAHTVLLGLCMCSGDWFSYHQVA